VAGSAIPSACAEVVRVRRAPLPSDMYSGNSGPVTAGPGYGATVSGVKKASNKKSNQPSTSVSTPAMKERILVVNDEDPIREIICSLLAAAGYQCQQASDGLKALAILDSGKEFDLLLCNLMMPNMDGMELLERTRHKFSDIPFVLESGSEGFSAFFPALRMGAYDYLQIPFEREQLLAVVRRALEYRRLKLENRALKAKLAKLGQGPEISPSLRQAARKNKRQ
jgi:DNA-binding NtrC family response regulator